MNVDDVVAAKIAAAARRAEAAKRRRAAFAAARKRGLAIRHAAKLRHLNSVPQPHGTVTETVTTADHSRVDIDTTATTTEENS